MYEDYPREFGKPYSNQHWESGKEFSPFDLPSNFETEGWNVRRFNKNKAHLFLHYAHSKQMNCPNRIISDDNFVYLVFLPKSKLGADVK